MNETFIIFGGVFLSGILYAASFLLLGRYVREKEDEIIGIFHSKVSKIPALIEVMRPHVLDQKAFENISALHTKVLIYRYDSIYDLLEYNALIHNEFLFLMQLSVRIPELQTHEYFLYIRDFIISYEREIHDAFDGFNRSANRWNRFVLIKNWTIVGLLLPGKKLAEIQ